MTELDISTHPAERIHVVKPEKTLTFNTTPVPQSEPSSENPSQQYMDQKAIQKTLAEIKQFIINLPPETQRAAEDEVLGTVLKNRTEKMPVVKRQQIIESHDTQLTPTPDISEQLTTEMRAINSQPSSSGQAETPASSVQFKNPLIAHQVPFQEFSPTPKPNIIPSYPSSPDEVTAISDFLHPIETPPPPDAPGDNIGFAGYDENGPVFNYSMNAVKELETSTEEPVVRRRKVRHFINRLRKTDSLAA